MKVLKQEYRIKAPLEKVWEALVDPKIINKWGAGPAKMKGKTGFEFSLWGGDIHGKNTKVTAEKELYQDWFGGNWEVPSKLVIKLNYKNGVTTVNLEQTDIPENEFEDITDGWKRYYFGEIKKLLEG